MSGIVLRKSGSIDFYYDFKLVETSESRKDELIYTAIDMDFNDIHFKCYKKEPNPDDPDNPIQKVYLYSCQTSWKQRIGILSSTVSSEETVEEIRVRIEGLYKNLTDENLKMSVTMQKYQDAITSTNIKHLLMVDAESFCYGLHMKVSGYLRLYSSFINVG